MSDPTRDNAAPRCRPMSGARLGGLALGLALPFAIALPVAAQDVAPPPPDDIAATVSACLDAGVDFSDCVDATVAELLPLLEAAVPTEGGSTGEAPPPPPVFVLPPLPLPLPPVLGGGAEEAASEEDAADDESAEDEIEEDEVEEEETGA